MKENPDKSEYLRLRNILYKAKDIDPGQLPPGAKPISDENARKIYDSHLDWTGSSNMAGFGVGPEIADDFEATEKPDTLVLRAYVREEVSKPDKEHPRIPDKIVIPGVGFVRDEFFVQVIEVGNIQLLAKKQPDCPKAATEPRKGHRNPLCPGTWIGIIDPISYSGTLGCFVKKSKSSDQTFLLSNSHVIAKYGGATPDTVVYQPAVWTSWGVASLTESYPVVAGQPSVIDAAIAEVFNGIKIENTFHNLGTVNAVANDLYSGQKVIKSGATTEITCGQVLETDAVAIFDWPDQNGVLRATKFEHQIFVKSTSKGVPFSEEGDSGSLVMTRKLEALGLLMGAATEQEKKGKKPPKHPVSVCNNIKIVFKKMNLKLY